MLQDEILKQITTVSSMTKRKEVLRWLKMRSEWTYMNNFLLPLHQYSSTPTLMHVGSVNSAPVRFIPLLFGFISDTKESNDIVGVKGAPTCKLRCRMCLSTEPMKATYANPELRRLDEHTEMYSRRGQEAWIKKMLGEHLTEGQRNSLR